MRDIRVSLLEADVAFDVVKKFVARVREKAVGEVVETRSRRRRADAARSRPQDHFVKICHDELEALMGPVDTSLKLKPAGHERHHDGGPAGLRQDDHRRQARQPASSRRASKPLLVAADIYRPAAVDQLKVLGEQLGVPVFHEPGVQPPELAGARLRRRRSEQKCDVVIYRHRRPARHRRGR